MPTVKWRWPASAKTTKVNIVQCIHPAIHPSIHPSIHCESTHPPIHSFFHPTNHTHTCTHPSNYSPTRRYTHQPICAHLRPSIELCVSLRPRRGVCRSCIHVAHLRLLTIFLAHTTHCFSPLTTHSGDGGVASVSGSYP